MASAVRVLFLMSNRIFTDVIAPSSPHRQSKLKNKKGPVKLLDIGDGTIITIVYLGLGHIVLNHNHHGHGVILPLGHNFPMGCP